MIVTVDTRLGGIQSLYGQESESPTRANRHLNWLPSRRNCSDPLWPAKHATAIRREKTRFPLAVFRSRSLDRCFLNRSSRIASATIGKRAATRPGQWGSRSDARIQSVCWFHRSMLWSQRTRFFAEYSRGTKCSDQMFTRSTGTSTEWTRLSNGQDQIEARGRDPSATHWRRRARSSRSKTSWEGRVSCRASVTYFSHSQVTSFFSRRRNSFSIFGRWASRMKMLSWDKLCKIYWDKRVSWATANSVWKRNNSISSIDRN